MNRYRRVLVFLAALSLPAIPRAQLSPGASRPLPKVVVRETDTPLQLGDQIFHFIARIQRIEPSATQPGDETTEWWELRDPKGGVVNREKYLVTQTPDGFQETESVSARAFTTKLGSGVLVEGISLPSAPGSGGWVQVFGMKWGPHEGHHPHRLRPADFDRRRAA